MSRLPELGELVAGRYKVESVVGEGGYGLVYRALQTGMERPVALKVLRPDASANRQTAERFTREAKLAHKLVHPNTIQLHDFGTTEHGCLYIAMELLEGRTLEQLLLDQKLSVKRTIHISRQILKSLQEAHQHNVIHRDLKPANIFLRDMVGERDFVKVLDFGIAKAMSTEGDALKTQEGTVFGTPAYMSPEQVRGEAVGPYSDLYSLGLLMVEMLTGHRLVDSPTPIQAAAQHLLTDPFPIPHLVQESPLAGLVQRAIRKDIHLRYPTANEMLADLMRIESKLNNAPVLADDDMGGARTARIRGRRLARPVAVAETVDATYRLCVPFDTLSPLLKAQLAEKGAQLGSALLPLEPDLHGRWVAAQGLALDRAQALQRELEALSLEVEVEDESQHPRPLGQRSSEAVHGGEGEARAPKSALPSDQLEGEAEDFSSLLMSNQLLPAVSESSASSGEVQEIGLGESDTGPGDDAHVLGWFAEPEVEQESSAPKASGDEPAGPDDFDPFALLGDEPVEGFGQDAPSVPAQPSPPLGRLQAPPQPSPPLGRLQASPPQPSPPLGRLQASPPQPSPPLGRLQAAPARHQAGPDRPARPSNFSEAFGNISNSSSGGSAAGKRYPKGAKGGESPIKKAIALVGVLVAAVSLFWVLSPGEALDEAPKVGPRKEKPRQLPTATKDQKEELTAEKADVAELEPQPLYEEPPQESDAEAAQQLFEEGKAACLLKQWGECRRMMEAVITLDPTHEGAYRLLVKAEAGEAGIKDPAPTDGEEKKEPTVLVITPENREALREEAAAEKEGADDSAPSSQRGPKVKGPGGSSKDEGPRVVLPPPMPPR